MMMMTISIRFAIQGNCLPRKYPARVIDSTQATPPTTLNMAKRR
jgi:hypothetical protein